MKARGVVYVGHLATVTVDVGARNTGYRAMAETHAIVQTFASEAYPETSQPRYASPLFALRVGAMLTPFRS